MIDKIKQLSDTQLIKLAAELKGTTIPEDALLRTLAPEGSLSVFVIIEINAHLTQELARRLAIRIFERI